MAPDRQRTASTDKIVMTYIAPRTEALARAMCVAVDYEPDGRIVVAGSAHTDACWHLFHWDAQKWIYEHSGGELPEREGEGRG